MAKPITKSYNKVAIPALLAANILAGIAVLDDLVSPPGESLVDDLYMSAMNKANGNSCVYTGLYKDSYTTRQKNLHSIYEKAAKTEIGAEVMQDLKQSETVLCYRDELKANSAEDLVIYGRYIEGLNTITLNSDIRHSKAVTLVHEGRHHQQYMMDLKDPYSDDNYPEEEILIRNWLEEADARLAEILYLRERYIIEGDTEYLKVLSMDNKRMVLALEGILRTTGDMEEAMRSAILAFRDNEEMAGYYDEKEMDFLETVGYRFDPDKETGQLLTDEDLMKIGDMGAYGHYMNEDFMSRIRQSLTRDDYHALREKLRAERENLLPETPPSFKKQSCNICS